MSKLHQYFKKTVTSRTEGTSNGRPEFIGSVFFIFIAILLTATNIIKQVEITMTIATSVLTLGFVVSALLAQKKKLLATRILIVILCGIIFSMFALIGGNDGFAILWILLVPVIGFIWVGLKWGFSLSLYFQLFLVILFYTPLSAKVADFYTPTFMLRFPMLYFASFGSLTFLMWEREGLFRELHMASYYDSLTELHNRRYYTEMSTKIKARKLDPDFVIFSFDLNRLKYANDNFGHQAGDELLQAAANIIKNSFKGSEIFRTGGDEFMAISTGINPQEAIKTMRENASCWKGEYMPSISISVGYASASENPDMNFDELAVLADTRMYEDKSQFYKDSGVDRRK